MDRLICYPGQQPEETHLLFTNLYALKGLGHLARGLFGTGPVATGLKLSANSPPGLTLLMSPGSMYLDGPVDFEAYSTLGTDTTHNLIKQGIVEAIQTLPFPAPGSAGQSINYLVQAQVLEQDAGAVVFPYYNPANPAVAFPGPSGSNVSQPTVRQLNVSLNVKAGTPAATGTQTTPGPDSGFSPLWQVTVANGQTTLSAADTALAPNSIIITKSIQQIIAELDGAFVDVASASTTDIGTALSRHINVTGNTTISSFGSSASLSAPLYLVEFASNPTIVHSSAIQIPGGADLSVSAGDSMLLVYLGSGNYRVMAYFQANAVPVSALLAVNGWEIRATGALENWGTYTSDVTGDETPIAITFLKPYPTAAFNVVFNNMNPTADSSADGSMEFQDWITSGGQIVGFHANLNTPGGGGSALVHGFMWRALGRWN